MKALLLAIASVPTLIACGGAATPTPVAKAESLVKTTVPEDTPIKSDDLVETFGTGLMFASVDKTYVEKRARVGETRSRHKTVYPFEVQDLPEVTIRTPFKDADAPRTLEGDWTKEVVAKRHTYNYGYGYGYTYNSVTVEGEGFTNGSVRIGTAQGMFYTRDGSMYGGVSVMCGPNENIQSARWEGLITKKGANDTTDVTYQIVDGWFDRRECKAVAVRRQTIQLRAIVPDTLYGFRECEESGCEGKTNVGFVIPNATAAVSQNEGSMLPNVNASTRIIVPVRRGGSEAIMATTYKAQPGSSYYTRSLSVEIVQGTSDEKPFATAFVEDPR